MALNKKTTANRQKQAPTPEVQDVQDSLAWPMYHQGTVGVYNQTHNWLY